MSIWDHVTLLCISQLHPTTVYRIVLWCALFCCECHIIGIDHDTVCAGVVGTAIRNSTSCAGRRRAGRHECCAGLQYQPRQRRLCKWSISILPRSQFYKKQGQLAFSMSCTAVRPHRRLRNNAWRRDSYWRHNDIWRHNQQATIHKRNGKP